MTGHLPRIAALVALFALSTPAIAQKKYDPGVTDTEIKVGNIMPYTGPASAYGLAGKIEEAFFKKINDDGGINGRKVTFISYDDGYSSTRAFEQARKLVEEDKVLLLFQSVGTPSNLGIMSYMNWKKVPQLFVFSGATQFGQNPEASPYTMGWQPNYQSEGRIYAKYILETRPDAKIAILFQNDGFGKDLVKGLKDGLGDKAKALIVAEARYDISEPTVDPKIVRLKDSGAEVFVDIATPKAAVQAIRKAAEIGWTPLHIIPDVTASVGPVLKEAGFEKAKGLLSTAYLKDTTDPTWKDDPAMKQWNAFLDKYFPDGDRASSLSLYAYAVSQTLVQVLKQCGDDLTRENIIKQATNLKNLDLGMLLPGIKINTSPTDYFPIKQMQMERFTGERWERFGPVLTGEIGG